MRITCGSLPDHQFAEIIKRLDRIEKYLEARRTRTWVKVGFIQELTGWDKQGLRRARESNLVK